MSDQRSEAGHLRRIGLFGGTFDPVHFGHLRMALELRDAVGFDEMRLLPSHQPAHRSTPGVSARHRARMLELALQSCEALQLDDRELRRGGDTFTVDTLHELRDELGGDVSLSFCMGMDSLLTLPRWHRWQELLQLAHLVVVTRPGWSLDTLEGQDGELLRNLLARCGGTVTDLAENPCGSLVMQKLTLLPISATDIRAQLRTGVSPRFLLPEAVLQYIEENQLYGATGDAGNQIR